MLSTITSGQALAQQFLLGMVVMASLTAGGFFLRFWRKSGDRLFAAFAIAFWTLAINWFALAMTNENEVRTVLYIIRLLAFVFLLIAIFDKNRVRRPRGTRTDADAGPT